MHTQRERERPFAYWVSTNGTLTLVHCNDILLRWFWLSFIHSPLFCPCMFFFVFYLPLQFYLLKCGIRFRFPVRNNGIGAFILKYRSVTLRRYRFFLFILRCFTNIQATRPNWSLFWADWYSGFCWCVASATQSTICFNIMLIDLGAAVHKRYQTVCVQAAQFVRK